MKDDFATSISLNNTNSKFHYFFCWDCHEFIKIYRKIEYSSKQVKTIDEVIHSSFSTNTSSICLKMGNRLVETLYCILEWNIVTLKKITNRIKEEVCLCIMHFCNTCCIIGDVTKDNSIPTGKVDRLIAFGTLIFVNSDDFKFTTRMKTVFVYYFSYAHFSLYELFLIERNKIYC